MCLQRFISLSLIVLLSVVTPAQQVVQGNSQSFAPAGLVLEDGTPLKLRISRTVSSADAKVGDTVDFEVLEEVRVSNLLVVPKGGLAWATVTEAQSKRRMARGGKLDINIDSVRLIDGEKVALRAVKEAKGGGHTGAMTGAMVGTAIVFFPAAPLFLFMHGKDITIPKGTEITAYINGNFPIDLAKFQNGVPGLQPTVAASPQNGNATLEISSTPPNADIQLDGSFAGNTPSSLGVSAGEHVVSVTKSGFQPWERRIKTATGNIKLVAELQPATSAPPPTSQPTAPLNSPTSSPTRSEPAPQSAAPMIQPSQPQVKPAVLKAAEISPVPTTAQTTASKGRVSITSTPDGAEIFVDSIGHGHSPAILDLPSGNHSVQLVMNGYKDWVSDVIVRGDSIVNVTASLEK